MIFTGNVNGYEVTASYWSGKITFRCDAISKDFDSVEQLEKAIAAYDLALRKQFSNPVAWMNVWQRGVEQVEITSVDKENAWIKRNGKREKVRRSELFEDRESLIAMAKEEADTNALIKAKWAALKRWEPLPC